MIAFSNYRVGDWVIYRKAKYGPYPGPRAHGVRPASKGNKYSYTVDKYWVVEEVKPNGNLIVRTRRGKRHELSSKDPDLRPASWYHRLLLRSRFQPAAEQGPSETSSTSGPSATRMAT
jgi:hypothetical protein